MGLSGWAQSALAAYHFGRVSYARYWGGWEGWEPVTCSGYHRTVLAWLFSLYHQYTLLQS